MMRQSAAETILSYWRSCADEGETPAQSAIEPRALKLHLPDLFILERLDHAVYAFRLAGTRLCARYGRELRDHDFVRLWPASQQGDVQKSLAQALRTGEMTTLSGQAATLDGKTVAFEMILMPLVDPNGRTTRLLGAMLVQDERLFRDGSILISQSLDEEAERPQPVYQPQSRAFAEARETKVSFLRIVDGGRDMGAISTAEMSNRHLAAV